MSEPMKPMEIEQRSFEIITELLGDRVLDPENELVIKRVIHTTADFDYAALTGVSLEAREKLANIRPRSVGQASRIPGVSPADTACLAVALAKAQGEAARAAARARKDEDET